MIAVISPAKNLDEKSEIPSLKTTEPYFLKDSEQIMGTLRKKKVPTLAKLHGISRALAEMNYGRNQIWTSEMDPESTRPAIRMFRGDVYQGMMPWDWDKDDYEFAQDHLRILSGLHGLLRPMDRIKPYRLEMGTKIKIGRKKNLYDFWGDSVTEKINEALRETGSDTLVNLASKEYFAAVKPEKVNGRVIEISMKEYRNGQYKFINFLGKKARGYAAAFMVKNRIKNAEELKEFNTEGYTYNPEISTENYWVFTRED